MCLFLNGIVLFIIGLGGLFAFIPSIMAPSIAPVSATTTQSVAYYPVARVVDGDTIVVDMRGVREKVRLIGINTPETVDPRRPVECFGKQASDAARHLLAGQKVRLETDPSQSKRDKYGRLLAYIFLPDGINMNQRMIAEGYAYEYTYDVPYKYQKEFKQAQRDAEMQHKGLWADGACGHMNTIERRQQNP